MECKILSWVLCPEQCFAWESLAQGPPYLHCRGERLAGADHTGSVTGKGWPLMRGAWGDSDQIREPAGILLLPASLFQLDLRGGFTLVGVNRLEASARGPSNA